MSGEYRIYLPLEDVNTKGGSPRGKSAAAWRRHWHILLLICKSLKKSKVNYEIEFQFGADDPYAVILAGAAVRQIALKEAA